MERQLSKESDSNENQKNEILKTDKDLKECPICWFVISNRALTDNCLHEFCYDCLIEWSRNRNRCPFCRQIYRNIICNIVSNELFDEIPVEEPVVLSDSEREVQAIVQRIVLFTHVVNLRNSLQLRRDGVMERLEQNNQRLHKLKKIGNELRQQNQDLRTELQRLDADIAQIDGVLNLGAEATEVDLEFVINGRHEELDVLNTFVVIEQTLDQIIVNEDIEHNDDNQSDQSDSSMPSLVSARDSNPRSPSNPVGSAEIDSDNRSNSPPRPTSPVGSVLCDSGDESNEEQSSGSDENQRQPPKRSSKRSHSSDSEDSDYCSQSPKRTPN